MSDVNCIGGIKVGVIDILDQGYLNLFWAIFCVIAIIWYGGFNLPRIRSSQTRPFPQTQEP
jgi:hypothetical protein